MSRVWVIFPPPSPTITFEKALEVCGEVRDENDFRISNRRRTNKKKECGEKSLRLCDVDVSRSRRERLCNSPLLGESEFDAASARLLQAVFEGYISKLFS